MAVEKPTRQRYRRKRVIRYHIGGPYKPDSRLSTDRKEVSEDELVHVQRASFVYVVYCTRCQGHGYTLQVKQDSFCITFTYTSIYVLPLFHLYARFHCVVYERASLTRHSTYFYHFPSQRPVCDGYSRNFFPPK